MTNLNIKIKLNELEELKSVIEYIKTLNLSKHQNSMQKLLLSWDNNKL